MLEEEAIFGIRLHYCICQHLNCSLAGLALSSSEYEYGQSSLSLVEITLITPSLRDRGLHESCGTESSVKVEWRCSCLQSMIKACVWRHAPLSQCHCDMCHRLHSLIRSEPTSWTRQIEHSAAGAKKSVLVFITRNYFTLICITLLLLQIFRCIAQMRNTGRRECRIKWCIKKLFWFFLRKSKYLQPLTYLIVFVFKVVQWLQKYLLL